jgi:hypothetical protein
LQVGSQTVLVRFACSLSASIDPNRPFFGLSPEKSKSLNMLPKGCARQDTVTRRKQEWNDRKAKFERACMACHARFGSLDEVTVSKYHRPLWEKLQRFQAQTPWSKQIISHLWPCECLQNAQRQTHIPFENNALRIVP